MGAEKKLIKHLSKIRDKIDLQKMEEKDSDFLIEKIISNIKNNAYAVKTEQNQKLR